ncbi:ABC-type multidrug transport system, ATPase and permease component [Belliella baltica DSM 15883]|uniref:ABC-type multidrug transport system, ATPase and permease component n=1 Tax=Belliella baltica (strain DSM 15883 / CIP 108006 / LMG 21964 / BA134) TaxID=866536 RepID=I3Z153_BELBD|nr:ABC transporter transmembrane domain-containing protein [Belliella baltica]AFL82971.1 ABC-type multidrug transport system, ATPase and permease component [Belliella baltica DSM 15883]
MNTYFRILSYARPFRRYIPIYVVYTLLAIVFGLLNFTLLKPLFDVIFEQSGPVDVSKYLEKPEFAFSIDYFLHVFNFYFLQISEEFGKFGTLVYVCIIIVISVFLANLFTYLSGVVLAKVRAEVIRKMRMDIFEHVAQMHIGYFSNERKGDLMSKMTNDIQEVENSIVQSLRVVFREPATIILYFAVLFFMSVKLTLFTILVIPISGAIIGGITKRLKKKAVESQESLGRIVNILDETIGGMRVIKAFGAKKYITKKFDDETGYYSDVNVSMAKKNELASPISQFMGVSVVAGILVYGGSLVLNNTSDLSASDFITYIIIFTQVLNPAKEISRAASVIQRGLASAERIFKVVDTESEIQNISNPRSLTSFENQVSFENVSFGYEREEVLKNINFNLQKGKTIALVGPSGGGKSTIADLVPRFYDPTKGQISIDGINLKELELTQLRSLMGIVTQESILFNDTVFNNIAFGLEGISEEKVIEAAKIANAHEFVVQLENGYQTSIGERGSKLSGGQRQRLSIARAVLKNPPILILDEATSALDSESELLVQEALTKLMTNRTTLVIAHRLSTIQHADEILVIQSGEIVQRGTHQELMLEEGIYKKLSTMQSV